MGVNTFSDLPEEDRILLAQIVNESNATFTVNPNLTEAAGEVTFAQVKA